MELLGLSQPLEKIGLSKIKNQKIKKQEFQREKLEEIFILMDVTFRSTLVPIEASTTEYNGAKLSMLIRFYFQNLQEEYKKYLDLFQKINLIKVENFTQKTNKKVDDELLKEFHSQYQSFLSCLVDESKKIKV